MGKLIKALPLLLSSLSLPVLASFVPTIQQSAQQTKIISETPQNSDWTFDTLKADIQANKHSLGKYDYLEYDGKNFSDLNQLTQYLFQTKQIESVLTSSDPSQLFKNLIYLNEDNKIYDLDKSKLQKVFRTANNNIAYSLDDALKTYVNAGMLKQEYSYDTQNWYRSKQDALNERKNDLKVNHSLYYKANAKYYNAFNLNDQDPYIQSTMEEGYSFIKDHTLWGEPIPKEEVKMIYGLNKAALKSKLHDDLKSEWMNPKYLNKIVKKSFKKVLSLTSRYDDKAVQVVYLKNLENGSTQSLPKHDRYNKGQRADIEITNTSNDIKTGDQLAKLVNKDQGTFHAADEGGNWKMVRQDWRVHVMKKGVEYEADIRLIPSKPDKYGNGSIIFDGPVHNFDVSGSVETTFEFYTSSELKDKLETDKVVEKDINSVSELPAATLESIYNVWFEEYFKNEITNFGANQNTNLSFRNILQNDLIYNQTNNPDKIGIVYKDWLYNVNENLGGKKSLIESYRKWLDDIDLILEHGPTKVVDGVNYYALSTDFENNFDNDFMVTKEDLFRFLPLQGKNDNLIMYYISNTPHFSNQLGEQLFQTENQAREWLDSMINKTLYSRFVMYDMDGNIHIKTGSEQEAIQQLRSEIKVNSKLVHRDEINSWPKEYRHSWDDVISNGTYEIFKVNLKNHPETILYYRTKHDAILALTDHLINNDGQYSKTKKELFRYKFLTANKQITVTFTDDQIDSIVEELLEKAEELKLAI